MKVLIKKAKVIAPNSAYHQKVVDILIDKGVIKEIGDISSTVSKTIDAKGLYVSTGFMDMRAFSMEPGFESMESLESLAAAAAKGGFTEVAIMPNTKPIIQSKESVKYFQHFSQGSLTSLLPTAAVTKDTAGEDFTEMWDLLAAGVTAFTDGSKPLWNSDILYKTLQYLYPKKALLMNRAEEPTLAAFGQMHEGITSTMMGTKGIPSEAEELMVMRDLKLLEYANLEHDNSLLHFSCISTAAAVRLIRRAKQKGLAVSCDIAAHQLAFIDEDLAGFDTNLKVNPPFRSKKDIKALQKGLADGTIDAIVSDHHPLDEEHKNMEFDLADFGVIGLQTAFAAALTHSEQNLETIIACFTENPRKLLNKTQPKIEEGELANLTVFNPEEKINFELKDIISKSKNSPFIGKELKGKIYATFHKGFSEIF
ncbi:dihydroorotase [Arcticibacterium luteifluviistationis]|uniref:Dihydroorotase n=1 Tax=Arcticibacterium luteifluviistationis TaxID=1784714 RepID=A0A2Z4GBU6_9BACT|nr:dihydroorotase [Arcticibacterium luteifluviistationis]AWV98677.1 dihydroorotase [Arcticibacterium luteifluviistationis]